MLTPFDSTLCPARFSPGKYFSEDVVYAACRCIEKLVEGLGEAFQAQASILLEPLFEAGLSTPLVKTLQVCTLSCCVPRAVAACVPRAAGC